LNFQIGLKFLYILFLTSKKSHNVSKVECEGALSTDFRSTTYFTRRSTISCSRPLIELRERWELGLADMYNIESRQNFAKHFG